MNIKKLWQLWLNINNNKFQVLIRVEPVEISNLSEANLTAYAVKSNNYLYITLINKEHDTNAHYINVAISAKKFTKGKASAMYLIAPDNNPGAMTGITLGGDSITNTNKSWRGKWEYLKGKRNDQYDVGVAPTSAAIVRIPVSHILCHKHSKIYRDKFKSSR